ncbi:hypothetical protein FACS189467_7710 [Bacteroidia bacterium]|nr:hypothetical protein FACS189467_7710 [Bacteroidia bacterium]
MRDSRFRTWAAGDCYLVYPAGRSSIRFERLIEGIQDYEKISILQAEFASKGDKIKREKLNQILSRFTLEELTKKGAGLMVETARMELNKL